MSQRCQYCGGRLRPGTLAARTRDGRLMHAQCYKELRGRQQQFARRSPPPRWRQPPAPRRSPSVARRSPPAPRRSPPAPRRSPPTPRRSHSAPRQQQVARRSHPAPHQHPLKAFFRRISERERAVRGGSSAISDKVSSCNTDDALGGGSSPSNSGVSDLVSSCNTDDFEGGDLESWVEDGDLESWGEDGDLEGGGVTPFPLTPAVTPFPLSGGGESVTSFTIDVFE